MLNALNFKYIYISIISSDLSLLSHEFLYGTEIVH